jgi:WD40 repeat protein
MRREASVFALLIGMSFELSAAEPARLDRFGDPLPEGAIYRLGTTRFRPSCGRPTFACAPDGRTFVTEEDKEPCQVRLWDSTTGKELWMSPLPEGVDCHRFVFSRDSKRLMVIGSKRDNSRMGWCHPLQLFDVQSGKPVEGASLPVGHGNTDRWDFLLDGRYFLAQQEREKSEAAPPAGIEHATNRELVTIVWDLADRKEVACLPTSNDMVVSPDGKSVAFAVGHCLRVWDASARKTVAEFQCDRAQFQSLSFSADSKRLAAIRDTFVQMGPDKVTPEWHREFICWDPSEPGSVISWKTDLSDFTLSPDARYVVAIDGSSRIQVRDLKTGHELRGAWTLDNWLVGITLTRRNWPRPQLTFASDGTLLTQDAFFGFRRFDPGSGRCLVRSFSDRVDSTEIPSKSPGLKKLAPGEKWITQFDSISVRDIATGVDHASFGQHRRPIWDLAITKKGDILLSRGSGSGLHVSDLTTGRSLPVPRSVSDSSVLDECFGILDDDNTVVAVADDAVVRVWEARNGKLIRQFGIADHATWADWCANTHFYRQVENWVSLSADKRTVAIAGRDRVAVWDVTSGRRVAFFTGIEKGVRMIKFAPDSRSMLIHTEKDSLVRSIGRKSEFQLKAETTGNIDFFGHLLSVTFSPDGKWIASASEQSITLYEVATGKRLWSIQLGFAVGRVVRFHCGWPSLCRHLVR